MGVLRRIFSPAHTQVWRQFCSETGAEFVEGGFWRGDKVRSHVGNWTVTLDAFAVSTGKTHLTFTRIRAPYVNVDGLRFTVCRKSLFSGLRRLFGMQSIETGDPGLDRDFIIKSNYEAKAAALFSNEEIRRLIQAQPAIRLEVKDDEGWFGAKFAPEVDELYFQETGVIRDKERLKALHALFGEVLGHLCRIGSACEDDPRVSI